jgi:hypothetical protein
VQKEFKNPKAELDTKENANMRRQECRLLSRALLDAACLSPLPPQPEFLRSSRPTFLLVTY